MNEPISKWQEPDLDERRETKRFGNIRFRGRPSHGDGVGLFASKSE